MQGSEDHNLWDKGAVEKGNDIRIRAWQQISQSLEWRTQWWGLNVKQWLVSEGEEKIEKQFTRESDIKDITWMYVDRLGEKKR